MNKKVLFVCEGNKCRSPMAQAIFTKMLDVKKISSQFDVKSAGLNPSSEGESYHSLAQRVCEKNGLHLEGKSKLFEYKDFDYFDYIIAMDEENIKSLRRIDKYNKYNKKISLFLELIPAYASSRNVRDPVRGGIEEFQECYSLLEGACKNLLNFFTGENDYKEYESDSLDLNPNSPFFWDHLSRYWWATQFSDKKDVLDCACGKGYGSFILSHNANTVVGIDLNVGSLELARENFPRENLSFAETSVLDLFSLEKKFDLIVAFEVIEHLPPEVTDRFLSNLSSALKPGGVLLLSTPNHDVVLKSGVFVPEFHINNFKAWELKAALKKHFQHVRMLGQFRKRSFLYSLLLRMDIFNLRHKLRRPVQSHSHSSEKKNDFSVHHYLQSQPDEVNEYVFSKNHWRQAGLTVAICKNWAT